LACPVLAAVFGDEKVALKDSASAIWHYIRFHTKTLERCTMRFANQTALLTQSALLAALLGVLALPTQAQAQAESELDVCAFETIIDLRTGAPTTAQRLFGEAGNTQLVFLGERHGTPEHVALASCILEAKTGSRPPVLALEHVPASSQRDLDDWRRNNAFDTDLFADIVDWESLGLAGLQHLPSIDRNRRQRARACDRDRSGRSPALAVHPTTRCLEVAPAYGLQTDEIVEAWIPDMIAGHCGLIDEEAAETHGAGADGTRSDYGRSA
jgi:hypothetical protein